MSVALSNITIAERWGDQPRRDRVLAILKVWDAASPHGTRPVPGMPTVKVQRWVAHPKSCRPLCGMLPRWQ